MSSAVAAALKKLLPKQLPPSLSSRPGNLYEVLARYPQDGIGQRIHQTRWTAKGISDCYWEVTRTKLKLEGMHGKAWGVLTWRGKRVSEQEEKIPGGLKYRWAQGASRTPIGRVSPSSSSSS
ncbi:hypothetical protein IEO21_04543 [Rhodonia placenta]|uniref:Uncharacterized protein n=2 Tax=Rhodonia placenta TaxID=104341 RepID=A0A1X6MSD4_9APHY|nr:hypothetical protein POSPLADRAFT_1150321 [Postia placenta MAD-698-R-SB12]KAF9815543.1 hypothetical protein IEO21_04543 [Postia placenta]OSX59287.1 hypothetical protein POSPLADRAFT_1150321 [Postia placenta MAD-698-R-SB12]